MQPVHVMEGTNFCGKFKKSSDKHESWSILKRGWASHHIRLM